jgi:two-component system OmpR family response regulator
MDGLEATRRIKLERPNLPIIVVSGWASSSDREAALGAGADGYLTKPYKIPELLAAIEGLLPSSVGD